MNWYKTSQVTNFTDQTQSNIGGPNINIRPLEPMVQEVVRELQAQSPGIFDHITDIVVDVGYGQFGSVVSTSPNTIRVNMNNIKDELRSKGWDEHMPEYKEQLKNTIKEVLIHEHSHTTDYDPNTGKFPGGEAIADRAVQQYFPRQ